MFNTFLNAFRVLKYPRPITEYFLVFNQLVFCILETILEQWDSGLKTKMQIQFTVL